MVPGQEVYVSATAIPTSGYPTASTVSLMPQTIDGTVNDSSKVGNFTEYTVSLANYDLFPMLANQPGQTALENNPSQIEVYVDSNTQQLNTQALAAGTTSGSTDWSSMTTAHFAWTAPKINEEHPSPILQVQPASRIRGQLRLFLMKPRAGRNP